VTAGETRTTLKFGHDAIGMKKLDGEGARTPFEEKQEVQGEKEVENPVRFEN